MRRCFAGLGIAAALLGLPWMADAGTIRGRVDLRRAPRAPEHRPNVADLGMPAARDAPDRRRSVVFLETAPRGAFEDAERPRARLDQRNEAFHPYVLAVMAGTTVDFPNSDPIYHNVFSYSKPRRFDLGRYPKGQSKSVRFDTPGIVRVFCDIHAHMSAYILVFAHPYFAATDAEGRYQIAGVPAGSYTLAVWTDGETRETRRVSVPEGQEPVDADFVVR
jgi:plastocyanin